MIRPLLKISIPAILATALLGTAPVTSSAKDKLFETAGPKPVGIVAFVEGPAWHPTGNVYFSDGGNNRIMRRDRTGAMHVYRQPSGAANGLLFDFQGRLLACEGPGPNGHRRITRTEHDGAITVLLDQFDGKRLNGDQTPEDVDVEDGDQIDVFEDAFSASLRAAKRPRSSPRQV